MYMYLPRILVSELLEQILSEHEQCRETARLHPIAVYMRGGGGGDERRGFSIYIMYKNQDSLEYFEATIVTAGPARDWNPIALGGVSGRSRSGYSVEGGRTGWLVSRVTYESSSYLRGVAVGHVWCVHTLY